MEINIKDKIECIVICISEFAKRYKFTLPQAFNNLKRWKGIVFGIKGMRLNTSSLSKMPWTI